MFYIPIEDRWYDQAESVVCRQYYSPSKKTTSFVSFSFSNPTFTHSHITYSWHLHHHYHLSKNLNQNLPFSLHFIAVICLKTNNCLQVVIDKNTILRSHSTICLGMIRRRAIVHFDGSFCPLANYRGNSKNILIRNLKISQSNDRNIFNR